MTSQGWYSNLKVEETRPKRPGPTGRAVGSMKETDHHGGPAIALARGDVPPAASLPGGPAPEPRAGQPQREMGSASQLGAAGHRPRPQRPGQPSLRGPRAEGAHGRRHAGGRG